MMIYDKIVESVLEPQSTSVLWLRPTGDGFSFYRYRNGGWEALKMMDDKGSPSPDDDSEIDLNNIPTMDTIDEKVREEVTEQIGTQVEDAVASQISIHDKNVNDVHYEESGDGAEYPDYSDIF